MDLSIAPYRDGTLDFKAGFDVGSTPGSAIEDAVRELHELVEDGELDEVALAPLAFWLRLDELGWSEPPPGWTREGGSDTTTTLVCSRKALATLIAAVGELRARVPIASRAGWDRLAKLCADAARNGGTLAIWYDPEG